MRFAVLAIAALTALAAVPSAQAQTRGFHGGAAAHVARGSNYGRGFGGGYNYGRGYVYGRGYNYGRGFGWSRGCCWGPGYYRPYYPWFPPAIIAPPIYPPVVVAPPAYDEHPPFTTQVSVQEWNGYGYVTVYRTVTAYFDYNTGRYYYVLDGRTYWLQ